MEIHPGNEMGNKINKSVNEINKLASCFTKREHKLMANKAKTFYTNQSINKLKALTAQNIQECTRLEKENETLNKLYNDRMQSIRLHNDIAKDSIAVYKQMEETLKKDIEEMELKYSSLLRTFADDYNRILSFREEHHPDYKQLKELKEQEKVLESKLKTLTSELCNKRKEKKEEDARKNILFREAFVELAQVGKKFTDGEKLKEELKRKEQLLDNLVKKYHQGEATTATKIQNFRRSSTVILNATTNYTVSANFTLNINERHKSMENLFKSINREEPAVIHAKKMLMEAEAKCKERREKSFKHNSTNLAKLDKNVSQKRSSQTFLQQPFIQQNKVHNMDAAETDLIESQKSRSQSSSSSKKHFNAVSDIKEKEPEEFQAPPLKKKNLEPTGSQFFSHETLPEDANIDDSQSCDVVENFPEENFPNEQTSSYTDYGFNYDMPGFSATSDSQPMSHDNDLNKFHFSF